MSFMTSATMWKARLITPDGRDATVQLPGMPLEPGARYYVHDPKYGRLCCAYCDTAVHYRSASPSIAGSSFGGRSAHFVTNPEQKHGESCLWELRDPSQSFQEIDPSKGYRIHINTQWYSDLYNNASGVYGRGPGGRIEILNRDLKGREKLVVKTAAQMADFVKKGNFPRVADSVVIFRNRLYRWNEFFIHAGNDTRRFEDLVSRARSAPKKELPACMMEFKTGDVQILYRSSSKEVKAIPIKLPRTGGKPREIQPTLDFRGCADMRALVSFEAPKRSFFVMGQVMHNRFEGDYKTIDYLKMRILTADQMVEAAVRNLYNAGLSRRSGPVPEL